MSSVELAPQQSDTPPNGVELAIERAGGLANVARIAAVSRSAVHQWRTKGVVPAPRRSEDPNHIEMIGSALGIPAHVLNPIVYAAPVTAQRQPRVKSA